MRREAPGATNRRLWPRALTPPQSVRKGCPLLEAVVNDKPELQSLIPWRWLSVVTDSMCCARYRPSSHPPRSCAQSALLSRKRLSHQTESFIRHSHKAGETWFQPCQLIQHDHSQPCSRWDMDSNSHVRMPGSSEQGHFCETHFAAAPELRNKNMDCITCHTYRLPPSH